MSTDERNYQPVSSKATATNLNFEELLCPRCRTQTMRAAGASLGGRINSVKQKCSECDFMIMIIPLEKGLEYEITTTTKEERIAKAIQKATSESNAELDRIIELIKERGY